MLKSLLLSSSLLTTLALINSSFASDSPKPANLEKKAVEASDVEINDPLEPVNRIFYTLNSGIDAFIMKPLAIAYRLGLPDQIRDGIGNFFQNLNTPVSLVNHMFQGQPSRAGNSMLRFVINTTVGFAGFFDAADYMGHKSFETGFNETMGVWGFNTGPYLVLPIFGPSSFRHGFGMAVDTFTKPQTYYFMNADNDEQWINYTATGIEQIHYRNLYLEAVDDIVDNSADAYATFRSVFFQKQAYRLTELKGEKDNSKKSDSPRP